MKKERKPYECIHSQGGLRARAWWVLRKDGGGTITGLCYVVAKPHETGATINLHSYFRALVKAGYLKMEKRAGVNHYTLINNSGPCAPIWRRTRREVYDQNTGEVVDISGGQNA